MKKQPIDPVVAMGVGLLMGVTTIKAAWPLTFRLCDWHHGFFMIAVSFTIFGYGAGKWAALRIVKNIREN